MANPVIRNLEITECYAELTSAMRARTVAAGNLEVFAEIGREFARFLATVPADAAESSPEFLTFAAQLRSGPPPGGQDYLREAFAHYQRQRREVDPAARAAWVLLGNVKIGLHEQIRRQPQIANAVDSPLTPAVGRRERALHAWLPGRRWPLLIDRGAVAI